MGLRYCPWGHRALRIRGAYVPDREMVLRQSGGILNIPVVNRVVGQSLLYHDSQFSAFSTEVLAQPNWGTIAVVLLVPR